jgi:outer membrane receptor protein involved in Fe transport
MNNKRRLASGISTFAVTVALCVAQPAHAQSEYGTLQGHVDGAKAGDQVVAVDAATGQSQTAIVDANGNYAILGVRPSNYHVTAGGQTQDTQVLVGQTVTVDFVAAAPPEAGAPSGAIVVRGRRTAQPVQAQTVATNVSPAQIENLPQNQRNFLSFANLAPGVQVAAGGTAQIQAGAIASNNVNVLLDGMSFKNPINHGGVIGQNFGLGNPFPQIAIQEYQVQTQNFGAETGQAGSALLTAITKSGGNEFHGSAFLDWQPKSFIHKPQCGAGPFDPIKFCKKSDYDRKQFGGELSGPVVPGKVYFYLGGEGTIESLPGSTGQLATSGGAPIFPANVVNQIVGTTRNFDFKQGLYFGKLTFTPSSTETINLSAYVRRENNLNDVDNVAAPSHGRTILTHQTRFQVQWRHSAGNFLNLFNFAFDKATQSTPTVTSGDQFVVTNSPCLTSVGAPDPTCANFAFVHYVPDPVDPDNNPPILAPIDNGIVDFGINGSFAYLGAHFFTQSDNQKGALLRDDATIRLGQQHTLKFGGQLNIIDLKRKVINFTNPSFFYFNPGPTGNFDQLTQQPEAALIATGANPSLNANDVQIGLYVQDEWKPDNHWTINAGLRWDYETNANNNDYITPDAVATALRNYPGWQARGINAEDYISNGHNRSAYSKEFQPRLGVSYDVHGDKDLVIFGGAGRYYDRSLFIEGAIEKITNSNYITPVTFCAPGTVPPVGGNGSNVANCAAWNPAYLTDAEALRAVAASQNVGGAVWVLPNKIHPPYSDQIDLGVRKRLGDFTATVTFSHIQSRHLFMFTRANFFENGWYTRFVTRDAAGNVTGCTNGGDAWIQDQIPGGLSNPGGLPVPFSVCGAQNGVLPGFSGKLNRGMDNGKANYNAIYLQLEKPFTPTSRWGFTEAFTYQRAKTNVEQELNSDEFYNGTEFGVYGKTYVNGVPKWRSVTSAIYRAPFDVILSGELTLSGGPAFGNINPPWNGGPAAPDGACCAGNLGGVFFPKQDIGYKRLDLRVAKAFKMPWGHELTVDFAAFNVFNWLNRNYTSWDAGGGTPAPRTDNFLLSNDQRSFQAGISYKF